MTSVTAWMLCSIFNEAGNNEKKNEKNNCFLANEFLPECCLVVAAQSEKKKTPLFLNLSKMFQ